MRMVQGRDKNKEVFNLDSMFVNRPHAQNESQSVRCSKI